MGPTGCGKSTLLSLLALLDVPDAGLLAIDGRSPAELGPAEDWRRRELGIVFQLHHLLPHLTTLENVLLPVVSRRELPVARVRAAAMLDSLGLSHRTGTLASGLSGGERQLAALARALVMEPRLLLADEPTGSVDSASGERILDTLLGWCHEHPVTAVVVTHDRSVAARLDRTIQMRDGRVVG
jgi:ABC-type lipoprotein export system ATPase subunit